jgi:cysteinyl-tRNA synthetase
MATWGQTTDITIDPDIESGFNNDLDTPKVILRLREIEKSDLENKRELFMYADQVLGLDLDRPVVARALTDQMQKLLDERTKARSEKRWSDSDALRVQLEELGLQIQDTADGQNWF